MHQQSISWDLIESLTHTHTHTEICQEIEQSFPWFACLKSYITLPNLCCLIFIYIYIYMLIILPFQSFASMSNDLKLIHMDLQSLPTEKKSKCNSLDNTRHCSCGCVRQSEQGFPQLLIKQRRQGEGDSNRKWSEQEADDGATLWCLHWSVSPGISALHIISYFGY